MKQLLSLLIGLISGSAIYAQHSIILVIKRSETNDLLMGATATIRSLNKTAIADSTGTIIFRSVPDGTHLITITYTGLEEKEVRVQVPVNESSPIGIFLEEENEHEEEVFVSSTRISRNIANTPTRVEVISGEELAEKGNMKPGDIRMLLNETTGIQTQQTSATSFNAGIRIQGLEGRYTQILRDGYPLYSGFAGGLSILQVAPLDLRQVEVIKGSASTLYGGGAIAGLVNLISKTPGEEKELNFVANATSAGGLDLSGFYSQRYRKSGITLFASRNSNAPYDPADIGLTAIPKFSRYTFNPRLFFYGTNTTADVSISYITEDRTGGSMEFIKRGGSGFFETNNSDRITTQFGITHRLGANKALQLRNSFTHFDRSIAIPGYRFNALQQSSFSELTGTVKGMNADWVIGANILTDNLNEKSPGQDTTRDYRYAIYGLFIQNAFTVSEAFTVESGLRGDYVSNYGFEMLPRVSAMLRITPKLTTRIGGGFGYKTPTIFTEEAERLQFQNILPVNDRTTENEESIGGNWDINYNTRIGVAGFSINHLFYYTRLKKPLFLIGAPGGKMAFQNADGFIDTKGMETNLRFLYADFKLFVGYTYTDANTHFANKEWLPLTARHRLNNVLMYELEDKIKIGLEAYYYSKQKLSDGSFGRSYWLGGLMAEKIWNSFSVYINFENFTNTRQSRFDSIYSGSINNPVFKDIYAPVEGFVVNGGIKLQL